jgi:signal peptidase II
MNSSHPSSQPSSQASQDSLQTSSQASEKPSQDSSSRRHRFRLFVFFSAIVLPLDQLTKALSRQYLVNIHEFSLGPLFLRFELAENSGAFLSLGSDWSDHTRFLVLTVAVFFILVWAAWSLFFTQIQNIFEFWGLQFLLIGGLGNLIDRVYKSTVTDFVQVGLGPLQTGIFNIADILILASLFVMILSPFFERKLKKS